MPIRPGVTRTIVCRMTGSARWEGRVHRVEIPEGSEIARLHVDGARVEFTATGAVEWQGDVPYEVWVPISAYGEWRSTWETGEEPPEADHSA